jgi:hypothetical protein
MTIRILLFKFFLYRRGTKKALCILQRTSLPRGTTSIYRISGLIPVPTDRKRNIGRTRLHLLKMVQQSRSERYSALALLLPCTKRQLSGRRMVALTGFRHRVHIISITLPLFLRKVNENNLLQFPKIKGWFCAFCHGHLFAWDGIEGVAALK